MPDAHEESKSDDMIGFLVKHPAFGLGRVVSGDDRQITVEFFATKESYSFSHEAVDRAAMGPGTACMTVKKKCRVLRGPRGFDDGSPALYRVKYEDGITVELPETKLTPIDATPAASCLEALQSFEQENYETFRKREVLADAWQLTVRDGRGAKALLSSRIDLRPHQAFVAGTVLLDQRQRYLLADEVGLGKTIEAGIIIHDLLWRNPAAKVLILCPGTLTQQWFCELYSKFCGRVFRMPELHGTRQSFKNLGAQVILSFVTGLEASKELKKTAWDLVVVDEVHHILAVPPLYELVQDLSKETPRLLLLSALPAQRQTEEYLQLLALLEPERYDPKKRAAAKDFKDLYDQQITIGRKLGYISRRLEGAVQEPEENEKVLAKLQELSQLPVLKDDPKLTGMVNALSLTNGFADGARAILHHVGDAFRINRRILRNRRSRLIEAHQITAIQRELRRHPFTPDQFEIDAQAAIQGLVQSMERSGLDEVTLIPLARQLFQALCYPGALVAVLELAGCSSPSKSKDETFALDSLAGYAEWTDLIAALWRSAARHLDPQKQQRALKAAKAWNEAGGSWERMTALMKVLQQDHKQNPQDKFVIFAGIPGLAEEVARTLSREFKTDSVARFHFRMSQQDKETEVRRFRSQSACWILVTDETGGEGRNFQFAASLIHFDLPWYSSKVEQRIGRLDRLGRDRREVLSTAIFSEGSNEEGLLECLASGFEIFSRSISGLEFGLHELEQKIVKAAISTGLEGLRDLVPVLKESAEKERATDEAQDVLDEASNERIAAASFRRVQSTPDRERRLEQSFAKYFQTLSIPGQRTVWFNVEGKRELLRFHPENLSGVALELPKDEGGHLPDRTGTFLRSVAQDRPDLEFFSVGNEFCDAVFASLTNSTKGRAYAVECSGSHREWRGFEFAFRALGKRELLDSHPGLQNRLERVFAVQMEHCFIGEDGATAADPEILLNLRRELRPEDKGRCWCNLTDEQAGPLGHFYDDWPGLVDKAARSARKLVRKRFEEVLEAEFLAEYALISEQLLQAEKLKRGDWKDEVAALKLLRQAIEKWDVVIDGVGFLSVNGAVLK